MEWMKIWMQLVSHDSAKRVRVGECMGSRLVKWPQKWIDAVNDYLKKYRFGH